MTGTPTPPWCAWCGGDCQCDRREEEEFDFASEAELFGGEDGGDCAMDRSGHCGKAGSEECEFECPYNARAIRARAKE